MEEKEAQVLTEEKEYKESKDLEVSLDGTDAQGLMVVQERKGIGELMDLKELLEHLGHPVYLASKEDLVQW